MTDWSGWAEANFKEIELKRWIQEYRKKCDILNQKLDKFFIPFSQKFQVSVPAECFSKEYSDSLKREVSEGSLPIWNFSTAVEDITQIKDESYNEEFNKVKLKQKDYVTNYQVRFEELKALILNSHSTLNESYFNEIH